MGVLLVAVHLRARVAVRDAAEEEEGLRRGDSLAEAVVRLLRGGLTLAQLRELRAPVDHPSLDLPVRDELVAHVTVGELLVISHIADLNCSQ